MKSQSTVIAFLLIANLLFGQVTDQNGNEYKTVIIGQQEWLAENYKATSFNDGTKIPQAKNSNEWMEYCEKKQPCWAFFNFATQDSLNIGLAYNFYAVHNKKNLAPVAWDVPDSEQWGTLLDEIYEYGEPGHLLKSTVGWEEGSEGIDKYGFNVEPCGMMRFCGAFIRYGYCADYWSISRGEYDGEWANAQSFDKENEYYHSYTDYTAGYYVRCVREIREDL